MPNFIILEDFFDNKASNQKIRVRDMKKFDKSKFLEDLQKLEIIRNLLMNVKVLIVVMNYSIMNL